MAKDVICLMEAWEGQQVSEIPIDSLVLWSENPRDPISADADNREIIENALHGPKSSTAWRLEDLAVGMGATYDCSELPTVVYDDAREKYIVFDGNRRIALAMIQRYEIPGLNVQFPLFPPEKMPCNVCDRETAIRNVYNKHVGSGSWQVYDRDVFANKYMNKPKSVLVRLEELIGAISRYPQLNQGYVRDDVLNEKHLKEFGLDPSTIDYGVPSDVLEDFVREIASAIDRKLINTRGGRNSPLEHIDSSILERIEESKVNRAHMRPDRLFSEQERSTGESAARDATLDKSVLNEEPKKASRRTRTVKPKQYQAFGEILRLRPGDVNNLYRVLDELWRRFESGQIQSSEAFPGLFRVGLRLVVEAAAREIYPKKAKPLIDYIGAFRDEAWAALRERDKGNDLATYLSTVSVTKEKLSSLLQTGAHCYSSSNNREQALALSIVVGAMLKLSHGKP